MPDEDALDRLASDSGLIRNRAEIALMRTPQAALDGWRAETRRPVIQLSRVLALSVGA